MLHLSAVRKAFGDTPAVDGVSFDLEPGALLAIIGESGSGKSTLLKMINRLIEPDAGEIRLGGTDIRVQDAAELRRTIGFAFQGVGLFPHMSVAQNVAITPKLMGWPLEDITARVRELLDLVKLPHDAFGERMPAELSGGQRQRVGFARALAARPNLLLLDEPFGALDPLTRDELQDDLAAIHADLGLTTIIVTHDMAEALSLADRIVVMRDGRVIADAPTARLVTEPGHPYVERLLETPAKQAAALARLQTDAAP